MEKYIKLILLTIVVGIISFTTIRVSKTYLRLTKIEISCENKSNWSFVAVRPTGYALYNGCTGEIKEDSFHNVDQGYLDQMRKIREFELKNPKNPKIIL